MNKLEKYSSYKDSGVEWLGEIPEHWKLMKLKFLANIKTGEKDTVDREDDGIYPFFVRSKDIKRMNTYSYDEEAVLTAGDGDIGKIFHYINGKFEYHQRVYKFSNFKHIIGKYLFYYLHHNLEQEVVKLSAKTTVDSLRLPMLQNFNVSIPTKQEQAKITSFLDKKTAQIDEVISQKEKLIELLKERKQIVINDAVTKGLDKNVEFVDSGIEWIGKIPKGWEVKKLKFIIKNKLKYGANESGISYDEALPRYVRITDFSDTGKLSEKNKLSLSWDKGKDYLLKDGDVLFARSGATVGKTYQFKKSMSIEKNYAFAGYLIKAEANETMILSDYLYLYTNSNLFNRWKESIFNKATIENIGADKYSELFFTLPSIEEQKLILKNYFIKSTKIDKAIELQQNYISKLKEYKASLIDSVVTGKVRIV